MLTFHRVLLICRVKLIMAKYSKDLVPATKKQVSWNEKRHTREAAEVLFSKSLYQRQAMVSDILKFFQTWNLDVVEKMNSAGQDNNTNP